ncbi:hypothetical protein N9602_05160 [Saprospiraceae bacterium]|nr:hypothetical protein [Saprospiraceae bacterium]MDA9182605.1 hypothetical protein [Saprospiraceae bacterium]MDB4163243.1 hypothetical protein [Saprospiraceae bacterium]MDC1306339.1 hypothetical protein [Saprospiraceae bacterium]
MKNILYILLFISSVGYSQTPITDNNFKSATANNIYKKIGGIVINSRLFARIKFGA